MSSGFVPAGTNEQPIQRDSEWLRVQQEIEAKRKQKLDEGKQNDGKSLYEVLQANKAAKQEAFEESARLKNQFRALDDDEVDFLDSVLESTRAKEAAIKQETAEQLQAFRKQQEQAEKAALREHEETSLQQKPSGPTSSQDQWMTKKRRRERDINQGVGLKLRKTSSSTKDDSARDDSEEKASTPEKGPLAKKHEEVKSPSEPVAKPPAPISKDSKPSAAALGLGDYDSDDD